MAPSLSDSVLSSGHLAHDPLLSMAVSSECVTPGSLKVLLKPAGIDLGGVEYAACATENKA